MHNDGLAVTHTSQGGIIGWLKLKFMHNDGLAVTHTSQDGIMGGLKLKFMQ